jgi:hypothetical protein
MKQPLPAAVSDPAAYKILLKKEKLHKPASVMFRKDMLEKNRRANYINEYDRISGLLEGHADKFNIPGGHHMKDKLINRQQMLKQLFKESHEGEKHPIMNK